MTAVAAAIKITPYYYRVFFLYYQFPARRPPQVKFFLLCSWNDCICGGSVSAFADSNKRRAYDPRLRP